MLVIWRHLLARCSACGAHRQELRLTLRVSPPTSHALDSGEADYRDRLQRALGSDYELRELVGRGGFGAVYAAWDKRLERDVAVKTIRHDLFATREVLQRFQREARAVAKLSHPNILPVYAVGDGDGIAFMLMPLVRGNSLKAYLSSGQRPSVAEAVRIAIEVAQALEAAHRLGIVHRDVKPENVLLEGDERRALLADFGIAKLARGGEEMTATGVAIGSPHYMSPEQALAEPNVDARSDVYSLGAMLYELLSGRRPYEATDFRQLLAQQVTSPPPDLAALAPHVSPAIAKTVMRAIAKERHQRWESAGDLATALSAPDTDSSGRTTRSIQRRIWRSGLAVGLIAVVVLVALKLRDRFGRRAVETRAVAVLPFENLARDSIDDYFAEGLTEEITSALSKGGLRVIGRSSARSLSSRGLGDDELGRRLRVSALLRGTVQRTTTQVRVTASLSNPDGSILWSEKYVRALTDIFALQDEIARDIAASLRVSLVGKGRLVRDETADPEAHALYLQGLYLWNRRSTRPVREALRFFEAAIQRDPRYAKAHAGAAMVYVVQTGYDTVNARAAFANARAAAERALELDSALAEAHAVLGYAGAMEWRNADAIQAFTRAIALDPNLAIAHFWYSHFLQHIGRYDEAIAEHKTALLLEPASVTINGTGLAWWAARQYAEAERMARHSLTLDPGFQQAQVLLAKMFAETERADSAIAILESIESIDGFRPTEKVAALAYAYARAGKSRQARRQLQKLAVNGRVPMIGSVAVVLDALGEREEALRVLAAAADRDNFLIFSRIAAYDGLRADPRGRAILERIEAP